MFSLRHLPYLKMTIKNYDIQAFIDEQLEPEKIEEVLVHIQQNPKALQYYLMLLKQKELLNLWWRAYKH